MHPESLKPAILTCFPPSGPEADIPAIFSCRIFLRDLEGASSAANISSALRQS